MVDSSIEEPPNNFQIFRVHKRKHVIMKDESKRKNRAIESDCSSSHVSTSSKATHDNNNIVVKKEEGEVISVGSS